MPARRRNARSVVAVPAGDVAGRERSDEGARDIGRRRLFILGAGADVIYRIPTVSALLRDLATFAREEGRPIHTALRAKLPYLHFTFDRYAGDQGDVVLSRLFGGDSGDLVGTLRSAAAKLRADPEAASVGPVLERLCTMAESNQLTGADAAGLARLTGEPGEVGDGEPVLDPERISLSAMTGHALRRAFQRALMSYDHLSAEEREALEFFIEATSNIEELMSLYFMKYWLGRPADQKTFLYIVWMLWAFLRVRSVNRPRIDASIYARLPTLGGDVVTFNYTNFFDDVTGKRAKFFHGRLDEYLRLETRELVRDDSRMRSARTVVSIADFVGALRLDVTKAPEIDLPSIVPPTSFKPVMARRQLRTWADVDELVQKAGLIVVVGYSFALADEHFNDLLRSASTSTRIVVVNPDFGTVVPQACRVLRVDSGELLSTEQGGFELQSHNRLTFVKARAEDPFENAIKGLLG